MTKRFSTDNEMATYLQEQIAIDVMTNCFEQDYAISIQCDIDAELDTVLNVPYEH
ncbi:hypothetical protein L1077_15650 [Pseudoalteromonas luteoviolacea]|uniref:hypothetical protein n=1 Tax=Pseudoalteromonas luteoviolacea TaxID=43657 RepID=UPI001F485A11|nr:hypothetical protein [Pseudoalteromonas luteoviolacea]MCF6440872.1 hypothetical protein [Pseudoalteromonas luteoviolacea]